MFGTQNKINSVLLHSLATQLSLYGLNPSQWELQTAKANSSNVIELRNRQDSDFRMQARIAMKRDRLSISQLSVVSI